MKPSLIRKKNDALKLRNNYIRHSLGTAAKTQTGAFLVISWMSKYHNGFTLDFRLGKNAKRQEKKMRNMDKDKEEEREKRYTG